MNKVTKCDDRDCWQAGSINTHAGLHQSWQHPQAGLFDLEIEQDGGPVLDAVVAELSAPGRKPGSD